MWVPLFPPVPLSLQPHCLGQSRQKHVLLVLCSRMGFQLARESVHSSLIPTEEAPAFLLPLLRPGRGWMSRDPRWKGARSQTGAILSLLTETAPSTTSCVARRSELGVGNLRRWFPLNLKRWSALAQGRVSVKSSFTLCKILPTTESPEHLTRLGWGSKNNVLSLGMML